MWNDRVILSQLLSVSGAAGIEPFTRREFFARAGMLGTVLVGSCAAGGGSPAGFRDSDRRRMEVMGNALLGLEGHSPSFDPDRIPPFVRMLFPGAEIDLVKVVRIVALAVEYEPVLRLRFKTFHSLPPAERESLIQNWLTSRFAIRRQLMVLLRTICAMSHYAREETWDGIGYDGPWIGRVPIPHGTVKVETGIVSADSMEVPEGLSAHTVVIGFGAGGGSIATALAEAGEEVLAIEAGDYVTGDTMNQREEDMIPRLFNEFGFRQSADRRVNVVQGKGVGGSTLHNINLCYRAPGWILEEWGERSRMKLWGGDELAASYDAVERRIRVNRIHESMINPNNRKAWEGATRRSWEVEVARHNRTDCLGSGFCELGCAYDRKNNVATAFLPDFVAHGGRVLTHARAERLEMENGRVTGVHVRSADGREMVIRCKRAVVSASAIDSPALLLRSGLGEGNPEIGRRLHLHPGTSVAGLFEDSIEGWRGIPQSVVVTEFLRPRPEGSYVLVPAFAHPVLFSALAPGMGGSHRSFMENYAHVSVLSPFIHDRTEGTVTVDGEGRPRIEYAMTDADLETLRESWRHSAEMLFAAGAARVLLPFPETVALNSPDDLGMLRGLDVGRSTFVSVHPQSTCRMGSDPTRGAVDEIGALFGCKGVYVCDTGLYPDSIGAPPQLTAMALGHYLGGRLASEEG